jgi:hypothetical protein
VTSFDARGYVSFETALSAHGVLDDLVHVVRVATVGSDRRATIPGIGLVEWIHLPDDLAFGDAPGSRLDFPGMRVAEPEKALCDLAWLCESRGLALPVHSLRAESLDRGRLREHARRMGLDVPWLWHALGLP